MFSTLFLGTYPGLTTENGGKWLNKNGFAEVDESIFNWGNWLHRNPFNQIEPVDNRKRESDKKIRIKDRDSTKERSRVARTVYK